MTEFLPLCKNEGSGVAFLSNSLLIWVLPCVTFHVVEVNNFLVIYCIVYRTQTDKVNIDKVHLVALTAASHMYSSNLPLNILVN